MPAAFGDEAALGEERIVHFPGESGVAVVIAGDEAEVDGEGAGQGGVVNEAILLAHGPGIGVPLCEAGGDVPVEPGLGAVRPIPCVVEEAEVDVDFVEDGVIEVVVVLEDSDHAEIQRLGFGEALLILIDIG